MERIWVKCGIAILFALLFGACAFRYDDSASSGLKMEAGPLWCCPDTPAKPE